MILLTGPLCAVADEAHYVATFSGVPLGTATLAEDSGDGHYMANLQIRNKGLMRMFKEHESSTLVEGWLDGDWTPSAYVSDYRMGKKKKFISLRYDENGHIVEREVQPPDPDRPVVGTEAIAGAFDPLSALLKLPDLMEEQLGTPQPRLKLRIYDGKRLMEAHGQIDTQAITPAFLDKQPAIAVTLRRSAIAGFTDKEKKRLAREKPLTIYYTRTDMPVLLGAALPVSVGEVQIRLASAGD